MAKTISIFFFIFIDINNYYNMPFNEEGKRLHMFVRPQG